MENNKKINLVELEINTPEELLAVESKYRGNNSVEYIPWAKGTPYVEIAEIICRDQRGYWQTPLSFTHSVHKASVGIDNILEKANEYIEEIKQIMPIDILSISARMNAGKINLDILVRSYAGKFRIRDFFDRTGEDIYENLDYTEEVKGGTLVIPKEISEFEYSENDIKEHEELYKKQEQLLINSSIEKPLLNQIDKYIPKVMPKPSDKIDLVYDLLSEEKKTSTLCSFETYTTVFRKIMNLVNGTEKLNYYCVIRGEKDENAFMKYLESVLEKEYVETGQFPKEDVPVMLKKLHRSLFQLYIVQDLIDDPNVTDVKITAPDSIRARVKGKAYITNINFIDLEDYLRFCEMVAIRNNRTYTIPEQTFTDTRDAKYRLRITATAAYATCDGWPYLHIRKVDRNKLLAPDLIKAGMMDEKIRDYLLDCGKNSRGVVFAGPPGSGKTVMLNWFLEEAYEQSAEVLVIQENDELFCYRKGVMFQHVVSYTSGVEQPIDLEGLGKLALVAGANVFVIGEAKGAEICSAITLSNSGCRTAITIHSPSSTETIDKMADLAMRGYAEDFIQAKRMLKSFETIVYLENFSVREISQITGFDEKTQEITYNYIYRKDAE